MYNWSFLFVVLYKPTLLPSTFNALLVSTEHCWPALMPFWFSTEHCWPALMPFWFSTEHRWPALMPFWFSTEHRWPALMPFWFSTEHRWPALMPFWFSTEHRWSALMPFWLSTDNICLPFHAILISYQQSKDPGHNLFDLDKMSLFSFSGQTVISVRDYAKL